MDGGDNGPQEQAVDQIKRALAFIRKDLTEMNVANDARKLDCWVVTHWDEDHHVGVKDLATEEKNFPTNGNSFAAKKRLLCGAKYDDDRTKIRVSKENKDKIRKLGGWPDIVTALTFLGQIRIQVRT